MCLPHFLDRFVVIGGFQAVSRNVAEHEIAMIVTTTRSQVAILEDVDTIPQEMTWRPLRVRAFEIVLFEEIFVVGCQGIHKAELKFRGWREIGKDVRDERYLVKSVFADDVLDEDRERVC